MNPFGYRDTLLAKDSTEARLADALFSATRHWRVGLHFNKGLAGAPPEEIAAARDTATNPAVLRHLLLLLSQVAEHPVYPGTAGHEPDCVAARQNAIKIAQAMNELRKIVPATSLLRFGDVITSRIRGRNRFGSELFASTRHQKQIRSNRPILCPSWRRERRVERRRVDPQELTRWPIEHPRPASAG